MDPDDIDSLEPLMPEGARPAAGDDDIDSLEPLSLDQDLVTAAQHEVAGDFGDGALGVFDGLLMNYGEELTGNPVSQGLVNMLLGQPADAPTVNPYDESKHTTMYKGGNVVGNVGSGVALGLATGGVGGIVKQAAIQGAAGAVAGYGREHDPMDALMGGATGAMLGGGARYLAGKIAPPNMVHPEAPVSSAINASGEWPQTMVAGELQSAVPGAVPKLVGAKKALAAGPMDDVIESAPAAPWSEGPSALSHEEMSAVQKLLSNGLGAAAGSPLRTPGKWAMSKLLQKAVESWKPGGAKLGTMARPDANSVQTMLAAASGAGAARAQIARPDVPTLTWALQSANAAGDTGLPPDAQQQLDEALMSGDDNKVSAVYMQNSMKYPAFQKRMRKELESINDGAE